MTELLNAEVDEPDGSRRPLTRDEVVIYASMVAGAGNETATRLIGFTMQLLAQHPDQRRLLVDDPSLIPAAIEEILRLESPSPVQARYVATRRRGARHRRARGLDDAAPQRRREPGRAPLHGRRTASTSTATKGPTWPSATGSTSAWARPWPGWRGGWCWRRSWPRWPSWDRRHRPWADGPHRQACAGGVTSPSAPSKGATMGEGTSGDVKRVVVWSTGGIGSLSIVAVNERPDLELVGVWVHSEDKVGKDAGRAGQRRRRSGSRPPTTSTR